MQTLNDAATHRVRRSEVIGLFGLPAVIAIIAGLLGFQLSSQLVGVSVTALSIFGALLFNLLILLFDMSPDRPASEQSNSRAALMRRLVVELHANVSFAVLLTLVDILAVLAVALVRDGRPTIIASGFVVYLSALFFLTLLMVLKRVHLVLHDHLRED